jgi:hypothetical protein
MNIWASPSLLKKPQYKKKVDVTSGVKSTKSNGMELKALGEDKPKALSLIDI